MHIKEKSMLTLQLYNNRILIESNGAVVDYRGKFSNSRMIIAEFHQCTEDFQAALKQAADKKMYKPYHALTGNLLATPICVDVREKLDGGLTNIEGKALRDCIIVVCKLDTRKIKIMYQGNENWLA